MTFYVKYGILYITKTLGGKIMSIYKAMNENTLYQKYSVHSGPYEDKTSAYDVARLIAELHPEWRVTCYYHSNEWYVIFKA